MFVVDVLDERARGTGSVAAWDMERRSLGAPEPEEKDSGFRRCRRPLGQMKRKFPPVDSDPLQSPRRLQSAVDESTPLAGIR